MYIFFSEIGEFKQVHVAKLVHRWLNYIRLTDLRYMDIWPLSVIGIIKCINRSFIFVNFETYDLHRLTKTRVVLVTCIQISIRKMFVQE